MTTTTRVARVVVRDELLPDGSTREDSSMK
jgi:hypothetical protein